MSGEGLPPSDVAAAQSPDEGVSAEPGQGDQGSENRRDATAAGDLASAAKGDAEAAASPKAKVWWKNPWGISALIGVAFMTIMAPMMKNVPEPPPSLGAMPMAISAEGSESALWSPDHVTLVAFSREGCFGAEEALFKAHASFVGTAFESRGGLIDARSVVVVDHAEEAAKAIGALRSSRSAYADWPSVAALAADVQPLRLLTPSEDGGCGAGVAGWLTIVDGSGQARGLYASSDEEVMSELHHRTQHVWFERAE